MNRRQRDYRKRIIIAYAARGVVALALVLDVFLVVCGCLYLRDLGKRDKSQEVSKNDVIPTVPQESLPEESIPETEPENALGFDFTVVVDPGHGGNDSGTNVTTPDRGLIEEKYITLDVAEKVQALLEEQGVNVIMTRTRDEYVSLDERVEISRNPDVDLFFSIHCNSYEEDTSVYGLECYHWKDDGEGQDYAQAVADALGGLEDLRVRGVKNGDYQVLRENDKPATLIEMGFITNPQDLEKLLSDEYQQKLAEKFVEGILNMAREKMLSGETGQNGLSDE